MARTRLSLALVLLNVGWLPAADLKTIERTIRKEPAYAGKPKYCLLVFGPEAKTRIWLALDGDRLYVDKNGNGDLTDDGPAVEAKVEGKGDARTRKFTIPELHDGPRTHKNLDLIVNSLKYLAATDATIREYEAKFPDDSGYMMSADVEVPGQVGAGIGGRLEYSLSTQDLNGCLRFTSSATEAPIVHFGGPLVVTF